MSNSPFNNKVEQLISEFGKIAEERKLILKELGRIVNTESPVNLNFICTHNSRRSQMAQVWGQAAANFFGFDNVRCFSSGTEVSAVHPNTLEALKLSGFNIAQLTDSPNGHYQVSMGEAYSTILIYSKLVGDIVNPRSGFIAIMTCSNADKNCPIVEGAAKRISLNYDDPGMFDAKPDAKQRYLETADRIGREMLYIFGGKS